MRTRKSKKPENKAQEEYTKYYCEECGERLNNVETRVYLENLYGIDPVKDKRKMCKKCKEKIDEQAKFGADTGRDEGSQS